MQSMHQESQSIVDDDEYESFEEGGRCSLHINISEETNPSISSKHPQERLITNNVETHVVTMPHFHSLPNFSNNRCYAHALLQCLIQIKELNHLFACTQFTHDNVSEHGNTMLSETALLFDLLRSENREAVDTTSWFNTLTRYFNNSQEQQDVQELFAYLGDDLSLYTSIFNFKIMCRTQCPECESIHPKEDPFTHLSLPIPTQQDCIENVLTHYFQEEVLDENNLYSCGTCQRRVQARKNMKLISLPPTLVVHLKRFQLFGNMYIKNNTPISFPVQDLNLKHFVSDESCFNIAYHLTGIILHQGTLQGGHYIAYVKKANDQTWWLCNDSIVERIEESVINDIAMKGKDSTGSFTPYMFFYTQTTSQPKNSTPLMTRQHQNLNCNRQHNRQALIHYHMNQKLLEVRHRKFKSLKFKLFCLKGSHNLISSSTADLSKILIKLILNVL